MRTLRAAGETKHMVKLHAGMSIWPCVRRRASWLLTRFSVRSTGRAFREEAFEAKWQGELAPFAETVLLRETVSHSGALAQRRRRRKGDALWCRGLYLGRAERTNEHIVGTPDGIFRSRTVRRMTEDKPYDDELLLAWPRGAHLGTRGRRECLARVCLAASRGPMPRQRLGG